MDAFKRGRKPTMLQYFSNELLKANLGFHLINLPATIQNYISFSFVFFFAAVKHFPSRSLYDLGNFNKVTVNSAFSFLLKSVSFYNNKTHLKFLLSLLPLLNWGFCYNLYVMNNDLNVNGRLLTIKT